MKGAIGMFGSVGKKFWCLQVSFLKSKSIQAKVRQTYLFVITQ